MKIQTRNVSGVHLVELEGTLDSNAAPAFEAHLRSLIDQGATRIVVDVGQLAFVRSSGLRVMLATWKGLRTDGGTLCVCNLNQTVQDVFEMSGIGSMLNVYRSAEEAIAAIERTAS